MLSWFLNLFRSKRKEQYEAAWLTDSKTINGVEYTFRELAMAERLGFQDYISDNEHEPLLAYAWLISTACLNWEGESKVELAAGLSPTTLAELGNCIIVLSGMAIADELVAPSSAPSLEEEVEPGTLDAAKKNSEEAVI